MSREPKRGLIEQATYASTTSCVHTRRTTVELDDELLERAQRALGCDTMRATIEEALRRVTRQAEDEAAEHRRRQIDYVERLGSRIDADVLHSDEMWR